MKVPFRTYRYLIKTTINNFRLMVVSRTELRTGFNKGIIRYVARCHQANKSKLKQWIKRQLL
jgi:hypothetical protein